MANENAADTTGFTPQPEIAKRFFDRAAEVAMTNNFDYALELYRDGVKWDPDSLDVGHKSMLEIGKKRKAANGRGVGMGEQMNARKAKEPNEKLSWASYFLAKEPDNPKFMEATLQAALKAGAKRTARWVATMLVENNRDSKKPVLDRYMTAISAFKELKDFEQAVAACQLACRLKPNDMALTTELKNLSAEKTIGAGNYENATDFKGSLHNAQKQLEQQQNLSVVNQDAIVDRQIADAKRDLAANPNHPGKVYALVEVLCRRSQEGEENEALAVLTKAYDATKMYRFRERIGDIRMRQYHRKAAAAAAALKADPENAELRKTAQEIIHEIRDYEEKVYADRVANYPTDMGLKFEYGRRLFDNGKFDQAIPILQFAEGDAKNRLRAMNLLGQAFFNMDFYDEAVSTFRRAISQVELSGSETAKELHYNLGRALESMGQPEEADKAYSQVVQWDFNYRDTRQRIQKLRQQRRGESAVRPTDNETTPPGTGETKVEG